MSTTVRLDSPLSSHVAKAAARRLDEAGLATVRDLIEYAPKRYYSWGRLTDIAALEVGQDATVLARVVSQHLVENRSGRGYRLLVEITDGSSSLTSIFFARNPYMLSPHRRLLKPGATVLFAGKVGEYRGNRQLTQPEFEELEEESQEAAARRAGRPIPIYRAVGGISTWKLSMLITGLLDRVDQRELTGPVPKALRDAHGLMTYGQALEGLHRPNLDVDWQTAKRSLSWMEALVLQTALLAKRSGTSSQTMAAPKLTGLGSVGKDLAAQLSRGLPFELTGAQQEAWKEISADLTVKTPMQRLLQADVGAGKTVVALLAMARAVGSNRQAALLAPTEVLARQHYRSITSMLDNAGVHIPVHLLTGKRASAEREAALTALASGEPSIVIGTHALLSEGVTIPNLALLVVDEQHRFGVAQRDQLRQQETHTAHLLVMTATPIPRTIAMTVFGDLDVTTMDQLPPGRKPVATHNVNAHNAAWMKRTWERAKEEVQEGGRVFVVCPRIDADETVGNAGALLPSDLGTAASSDFPAAVEVHKELQEVPALRGIPIGLAHGRRTPEENAEAFAAFASGATPILVATTVIEVGVDVPDATMMVVLGANRFGLSTLHQLRGRVGRSDRESVCLLVSPPTENQTTTERLQAVEQTTDGFTLAEADLRLRSEGDVLGSSQAGRMSGLRFLSVIRDGSVISAARNAAADILAQDPNLEGNPDLRAAVKGRVGDDLVWLERN